MSTWSSAVEREGAWWTTDTLPSFPSVAALQKTNGGKFDGIYVRMPDEIPTGRYIVIDRDRPQGARKTEERVTPSEKERHHLLRAIVYWWPTETTGLAAELLALEQGLDDVLTRIIGPTNDKSHGAQFQDVGESPYDIELEWAQDPEEAFKNGEPAIASFVYEAIDHFVA